MINNTNTVNISLSTLDQNRNDSELDEPEATSNIEEQIDPVSCFYRISKYDFELHFD